VADEFLTVPEVAERLKVSGQTIYRWIDEGMRPAVQFGKQYRVRSDELEQILARGLWVAGGGWSAEPRSRPDVEE
jgi:excisionase family DNA binding protein